MASSSVVDLRALPLALDSGTELIIARDTTHRQIEGGLGLARAMNVPLPLTKIIVGDITLCDDTAVLIADIIALSPNLVSINFLTTSMTDRAALTIAEELRRGARIRDLIFSSTHTETLRIFFDTLSSLASAPEKDLYQ